MNGWGESTGKSVNVLLSQLMNKERRGGGEDFFEVSVHVEDGGKRCTNKELLAK